MTGKGYLSIKETTQQSSTVPSGNAIDIQDANGNSLVGKTEPVTTPLVVVVSGGPGTTTVPSDVVNIPCSQADQELTNDGFNVNSQFTEEPNASFAAGNVITTDPAPNSVVAKGSAISITCSEGAGTPTAPSTTPSTTVSATATDTSTAGNGNGGFIGGFPGTNN